MTDMTSVKMLEGVRIVDLTSIVFGPYCTQILADLGADVIKVESPHGDPMRMSGHFARTRGMGAPHMTLNRGKRSIVLDLKSAHGREALNRLLLRADIFIHNVRAHSIRNLGFSYDQVAPSAPSLIYIHCVGYGSDGPYADLPAYDDVIQAASGLVSLPGRVDGNARPRYFPSTVVDKVAGLHAAYATLAAYVHRMRSGEGQFVEVPMFETFTHFLLEEHLAGGTFDPSPGPIGYRRQLEPHRQPFPTADGYISIVPYGDPNWVKLFTVMEHPEVLEEPEFSSPQLRITNAEHLYRRIGELTPRRRTQDWMAILGEADIPAMPVRDIADILEDPHLVQTGFFRHRLHPSEGAYREMQPPVRFSARSDGAIRPPARLGEHTADILAEIGLEPEQNSDKTVR